MNKTIVYRFISLSILIICFIVFYTDLNFLEGLNSSNYCHYSEQNTYNSNKKDWNDYKILYLDSIRKGFGEHGEAAVLNNKDDIKRNKELFKIFGMSVITSDKISVNRSVPDFRSRGYVTGKDLYPQWEEKCIEGFHI